RWIVSMGSGVFIAQVALIIFQLPPASNRIRFPTTKIVPAIGHRHDFDCREGKFDYGTIRMLCMAALNETPEPTTCGSHHTLRSRGRWLTIIRLPIKSNTRGLTCVAAYNAPECENGRSMGLPSTPYPREIARRVDHASNEAAPAPVKERAYQSLRCREVS